MIAVGLCSQEVPVALLSCVLFSGSLDEAAGKLSQTAIPFGLLWIIDLSLPTNSHSTTDHFDPRSSEPASKPYIISRDLPEQMGSEHKILLQCFALGNIVIITPERGELARNNYKEGSHISRFRS